MDLIPLTICNDQTQTRQSICQIDLTPKVDFCKRAPSP